MAKFKKIARSIKLGNNELDKYQIYVEKSWGKSKSELVEAQELWK